MAEGDAFDPIVPLVPVAEPEQQEVPSDIDTPPPGDVADVDTGADGEEEQIETIEVEIGGKKYIVPRAVEEHLLREEDYTQKTQTLAEQRKEIEAYQLSLQEKARIQEAVLEDAARVRGLEAQIIEYDKIDWPAYHLQDPNAAGYYWMQFQQLQRARDQAAYALNEKMQQVSSLQAQSRTEAIQKTITALSKPDPSKGWPGYSPAYMTKLTDAALELGFTNEQLTRITSPESIKALNLAVIGARSLKAATGTTTPKTVEAQPVRQISSNRGRPSSSGSGDHKSVEQWVIDERARLAKLAANGRLRT